MTTHAGLPVPIVSIVGAGLGTPPTSSDSVMGRHW